MFYCIVHGTSYIISIFKGSEKKDTKFLPEYFVNQCHLVQYDISVTILESKHMFC